MLALYSFEKENPQATSKGSGENKLIISSSSS
jgi:hypothetical protein